MIRVVFFGTPDFSVECLQALYADPGVTVGAVVTQPDKPAGRGAKVSQSPVKLAAVAHGTPVLQPISVRKEAAFLDDLTNLGPFDVGVVVAFGQILPQRILDLPRSGCVNVHASLLPRWRGAAPIQRCILAGDADTGICLMRMEAGLDTGPVFARAVVPDVSSMDAGQLHDRLAHEGSVLLKQQLAHIVEGSISPESQPMEGVTYAEKIRSEEALIQWAVPSETIDRIVRAFSPFPGAYTFFEGKRLKILRGQPVNVRIESMHAPGNVSFVAKDRLEIRCGTGEYRLLELQLEGKRRMSVEEFLRGYSLSSGVSFG